MKWLCPKCKAINPQFGPKCHNCGSSPSRALAMSPVLGLPYGQAQNVKGDPYEELWKGHLVVTSETIKRIRESTPPIIPNDTRLHGLGIPKSENDTIYRKLRKFFGL